MINNTSQTKSNILPQIYDAAILNGAFACKIGCDSCCTESVTISGLEGELIFSFLKERGRVADIQTVATNAHRPTLTTNQYVRQFVEQRDICVDDAEWSFAPCQFLSNGACSIYEVRPCMCRGFVSLSNCAEQGFAEVPPQVVTFNTIVLQVIEHLSAGKPWGLISDILKNYGKQADGGEDRENVPENSRLLVCKKISGIIMSEHEQQQLAEPLERLKIVLQDQLKETPEDAEFLLGKLTS